jgi:hypothetical protein
MQLSAFPEVKLALAAARKMRRPMPLLRAVMAAAEQTAPSGLAGASLAWGPDYAAVLAALLAAPAGAGTAGRTVSPLRAVAPRISDRSSRGADEAARAPGPPVRQAAPLRAVVDSGRSARSRPAPALRRGAVAEARAELRRGHMVVPTATMMERTDADRTEGPRPVIGGDMRRRPTEGLAPPGIGNAHGYDPRDDGAGQRASAGPSASAKEKAAPYRSVEPGSDRSDDAAEARAGARRRVALPADATILQDAPAQVGPTDRAAGRRRAIAVTPPSRGGERAIAPVAEAASSAAVSEPIAPPARRSPEAAGAASPVGGKAALRAVAAPAARPDPAKLDDAGTALAEAAWRNGVDAS